MADRRLGLHRRRTALVAHPGTDLYGAGRVVLETVAGLLERDWTVVLVLPGTGALATAARGLGADVVLLPVPAVSPESLRIGRVLGTLLGSLAAVRRVARLLRRLRPSVVHVSTLALPLWITTARVLRIPVLCHVHSSERTATLVVREALIWPLLLTDRVVASSGVCERGLLEVAPSLGSRSTVIRNGVTAPVVRLPRAEIDDELRVLVAGPLSPDAGVDVALEALALLVADGFPVRLDIVGEADAEHPEFVQQVRNDVARLGLTEWVFVHAFAASASDTLSSADVAVVPSRLEETSGDAAVEAVLSVRPVVFSTTGGLAEAVDGAASAIPVQPDDPYALAQALQRVRATWPIVRQAALTATAEVAHRHSTHGFREAMTAEMGRLAVPRSSRSVALAP